MTKTAKYRGREIYYDDFKEVWRYGDTGTIVKGYKAIPVPPEEQEEVATDFDKQLLEIIESLPQVPSFILEYNATDTKFAEKVCAILEKKRTLTVMMAAGNVGDDLAIRDNVLLFNQSPLKFINKTATRFEIIFVHSEGAIQQVSRVLTNFGKMYMVGDDIKPVNPPRRATFVTSETSRVTREDALREIRG
jgi:hypothetical protein